MPTPTGTSSPLTRALLAVDALRERSEEAGRRAEQLFREWEAQWNEVRFRIGDRLQRIDQHLGGLAAPRLGLVDDLGAAENRLRVAPMAG